MTLPAIIPKYRNYLILSLIATKLIVAALFWQMLDMYDYQLYFQAITNITQGLLPWANGVAIYYPPLALVPMAISYCLAMVLGGFTAFFLSMWMINAACDLVTAFCIYWIGLKLYSERTSFIAAMLYVTGISIAYFSLTKFDSIPACLAMLAVLFALYGESTKGYLLAVIGLFTKIWPIVIYPFIWIYQGARITVVNVFIIFASASAFLVMILLGYDKFLGYMQVMYCNTIPYLFGAELMPMLGINMPYNIVIVVFHLLTAICILIVLFWSYNSDRSVRNFLVACLISIAAIVLFAQYRSPQYMVWLMPFFALLLADRSGGILLFIALQILGVIEFPITFYSLYVNEHYTSPFALVFFIVLFGIYGASIWVASGFSLPTSD